MNSIWDQWLAEKVKNGLPGLPPEVQQVLSDRGLKDIRQPCKGCVRCKHTIIHSPENKLVVVGENWRCTLHGGDTDWSPDYPACLDYCTKNEVKQGDGPQEF